MLPTESFHARTRAILREHPLPLLFPPEPWSQEDLEVIAEIFKAHVSLNNEVITDEDPYTDWLERWAFYREA